MNAISYTVFGFNQRNENCMDFRSYVRGLHINTRMAGLLYPGWKIAVTVDEDTMQSKYGGYFRMMQKGEFFDLNIVPLQPLCMMMLYRLDPIFTRKYDRVLCRDTDSLLCLKERYAVMEWEKNGRIAHVITDSVSHTIPMMGGMCGFMAKEFREMMGETFTHMMQNNPPGRINFTVKGSDQDYLNRCIMPKVAHSITEHYLKGMPYSFREDCHQDVKDYKAFPNEFAETNGLAFHIGAAGYQVEHTLSFLSKHDQQAKTFDAIEGEYPEIFYWKIK